MFEHMSENLVIAIHSSHSTIFPPFASIALDILNCQVLEQFLTEKGHEHLRDTLAPFAVRPQPLDLLDLDIFLSPLSKSLNGFLNSFARYRFCQEQSADNRLLLLG